MNNQTETTASTRPLAFTGERFVPEIQGNIVIEHYHRYLFAKQFVAGKTVLDIACGEGYGSALLADSGAEKVFAVDISARAIEHAREKYAANTLHFICGDCANIPLPDGCVDVITSFETIEHHDRHDESMREFRRVLKPDGILVMSSPDRKTYSDERNYHNPYHVRELYLDEFRQLVSGYFKHVSFYHQKILFGSILIQEGNSHFSENWLYAGGQFSPTRDGIVSALYHVAVASNTEPVHADSSLIEQPVNDSEVVMEWSTTLAARDRQVDELATTVRQLGQQAELLQVQVEAQKSAFTAAQELQVHASARQIADLGKQISSQETAIKALKTQIDEYECRIGMLNSQADEYEHRISELKTQAGEYEHQISELKTQAGEYEQEISSLETTVDSLQQAINHRAHLITYYQNELHRRESRVSKTIRVLKNKLRPLIIRHFPHIADLYQRWRNVSGTGRRIAPVVDTAAEQNSILILTPPHTLFIARLMAAHLHARGVQTRISTAWDAAADTHCMHIVLCPQIFDRLPPAHKTVIFQLEQSINARWFTPAYLELLKSCAFILEYKVDNIEFLVQQGVERNKLFYLPLGGTLSEALQTHAGEPPATHAYDFIFYGDSLSSPRRRAFLDALGKQYRVKICNDVFGDELYGWIRQAKCVVNIHYYENALLETPRIFEALSLGVPVLSEYSTDSDQYPELAGSVLFFRYGSVEDMLKKAARLLERADQYAHTVIATVEASQRRFRFMFDRALAGTGMVDTSVLLEHPVYIAGRRADADPVVALSLPETTQRRLSCLNEKSLPPGFSVFDGIRFKPGWKACAYSYKAMARHFLHTGATQVTLFEDDAFLRSGDTGDYNLVREYLQQRETPWDLFVGIIADVNPKTRIINVERWNGKTFLTIDKMTSTVFNIYNRRGLEHLASWNEHDGNVETNTIDRHLETIADLRVVVALPFIAGHKEELDSTIWGFQNTQYIDWIKSAENKLHALLKQYEARHADVSRSDSVPA